MFTVNHYSYAAEMDILYNVCNNGWSNVANIVATNQARTQTQCQSL